METATEPTNGRSRGTRVSRRVRIAIPLATAAVALSVVSAAWACTTFKGQTYFNWPTLDDLESVKKGSRLPGIWGKGVVSGDNYPTDNWRVVASAEGQCCGSGTNDVTNKDHPFTLTLSPPPEYEGAQLGPTPDYDSDPLLTDPQWAKAPAGTGTFSVCWLRGDRTGKALSPAVLTTTNN